MRQLFAVAAALATVACASAASAAGPSAAVLVGNGFKDFYNVGFGVRGGSTLPVLPLYVGGTFMYHLGTSVNDIKTNVLYLGPEAGYELSLGPVTIRPYLGLGYANIRSSGGGCSGSVLSVGFTCIPADKSAGKIAVWPGVTGLVGVGPVFVGADLRYTVVLDVPEGNANAFGAFATLGMGF